DQKAVRRRGPGRVVLGSKPQLATTEKLVRWAARATSRATSYFPRYLLRQRGPRAGSPRRLLRGRLGRPRLLLLPLRPALLLLPLPPRARSAARPRGCTRERRPPARPTGGRRGDCPSPPSDAS